MDELLAGPIPRETDATCDDCSMCADGKESRSSATFFNPETKCCTYIPELPNYLVGRILADNDPGFMTGRQTIEARVRAGVGVTPLGLAQPPNFQVLYGQSSESLFGRSRTLRCPHYLADEGGRCGVWKHRAAICATWYCKFVRGAVGSQFWQSMYELLVAVESCLVRWCLFELDVDVTALRRLIPVVSSRLKKVDPEALDGVVNPANHKKLWGKWAGREAEFYRECAQRVEALGWQEVLTIGGPELKILAKLALDSYAKLLSKKVPARLQVGAVQIASMNADYSRMVTYSPLDALDLPTNLVQALHHFDGRPTKDALRAIATEHEIRLDASLVRKLNDFEVLVSSDP
jgi:hypothetical protein